MRLFLRKHGWIRLDGIGYENDITDLKSACEALWRVIEFTPSPPAVEPQEQEFKPIAGPSTPPKIKAKSPSPDPYFIDLTLSDDDEDVKLISPKKKKKRLGDCDEEDEEMDLTKLAEDKEVLALEDPEIALGLLTMEELVALGKRMKVTLPAGKTTVRSLTFTFETCVELRPESFNSVENGRKHCYVLRISPHSHSFLLQLVKRGKGKEKRRNRNLSVLSVSVTIRKGTNSSNQPSSLVKLSTVSVSMGLSFSSVSLS